MHKTSPSILPHLWLASTLLVPCLAGTALAADLPHEFANPPDTARPWVYWFPLSGNLTREWITADLEAMQRVGIGGVLYMEVDQGTPKGPAPFAGPKWKMLVQHACSEAQRLGLEISMNNDAGWCGSGGPWITAELSMQKITASETFLEGPMQFEGSLPRPPLLRDFYRDITVLAFPTLAGDDVTMSGYSPKVTVSVNDPKIDPQKLLQRDPAATIAFPVPTPQQPQWVQVEFSRPFPARGVALTFDWWHHMPVEGFVQVSTDGKGFKNLQPFHAAAPDMNVALGGVESRFFRIVFTGLDPRLDKMTLGNLELTGGFRIDGLQKNAMFTTGELPPLPATFPAVPAELVIPRGRIVELAGKMNPDGKLTWDVPPGNWTILRIGHTSTGKDNHPAPSAGRGLECDKLSQEAIRVHFDGLVAKVVADNKPLASKTLVRTHIDSWEVGSQNWTPRMREEFRRRRGYDLLPLLPVMTGRVVDSAEVSERFLADLRQTVSDLIVENYAGHMRTLAHRHGLALSIEAYGSAPTDNIAYASQADEPMGEFWSWPRLTWIDTCTQMASAAHVYGKRIVGVEAFTANHDEKWLGHPGNIKDMGDVAFCEGINRFVFHRFAAQPWLDVKPGISMGGYGLHYERTQTWWEQSRPWHEYLARCQFLLRQGRFVADVCYLQAEGAPRAFRAPPEPGGQPYTRPGYNFDGCTADVVLSRMSVRDGRLVLPDGMSYRLLVLPDSETMTPQLLRKVKELVDAGATVVAPKRPQKSPSLSGYPECDAEVARLAESLWSSGKIVVGQRPAAVLAANGVPPDFSATAWLRHIHRTMGDADLYFVANPEPHDVAAVATFRVQGKRPELWWPDTGRMERVVAFEQHDGRTHIPLQLEPNGSVFVVFRKGTSTTDPIVAVSRNGQMVLPPPIRTVESVPSEPVARVRLDDQGHVVLDARQDGRYEMRTASGKLLHSEVQGLPAAMEVMGPWELTFPPKLGAPPRVTLAKLISWSEHPDSGIKYFSGTATYPGLFTTDEMAAAGNSG